MNQLKNHRESLMNDVKELEDKSKEISEYIIAVETRLDVFFKLANLPENSNQSLEGELLEIKTSILKRLVVLQTGLTFELINLVYGIMKEAHAESSDFLKKFNGILRDSVSGQPPTKEVIDSYERLITNYESEIEGSIKNLTEATDEFNSESIIKIQKILSPSNSDDPKRSLSYDRLVNQIYALKQEVKKIQRNIKLVNSVENNFSKDFSNWLEMFGAKTESTRQEWASEMTMKDAIYKVYTDNKTDNQTISQLVTQIFTPNYLKNNEDAAQKNIVAVLHRHSDVFLSEGKGIWSLK